MSTQDTPFSEAQMRIRKPASEVFEALVNPEITKNFWFTKGSDRLTVGKEVIWEWEMYNITTKVVAQKIIANKHIQFNWYGGDNFTKVDFDLKELSDNTTFLTAKHYELGVTGSDLIEAIKDSTGAFHIVLIGLKSYLEYGINLRLIEDKFPKEIMDHS
ncbi:SRPBCC domain-containing protein [Spongiivirga citrea]|uniref:Polyketide cyclase n=1 Tax=Spongiivirga citrea TaxID=1481457 RepID=A0A6M0CDS0_9FLAO|nr:SRPBCC domain-containing protein [Spongiivirga citrea]NER15965.1 polyketide cyclase [Spongiivirga citrea]